MMSAKIWEALSRALTKAPHHSKVTDTKTEDLLAFNTITTMLTYFRAPNNRLATNVPIGIGDDDRRILKVLDAVSAVLIREHEVTAVVAKPYEGSKFQVFASVTYPGNTEPLLQSSAESSFWDRFIVGVNPRDNAINRHTDSLLNSTLLPIFGDHKDQVPQKLIDAAQEKLDAPRVLNTFLETCWGKESFDTHAWMLRTLLQPSTDRFSPFLLYVIAVSFPKMIRRTKKHLSTTYMDSLLKLKSFAFIEKAQKSGNSNTDQDRDQSFIHSMPRLVALAQTKIPNLECAAKQQQPVAIYNKNTYMEFHLLLCELLTGFCASLIGLQTIRDRTLKDGIFDLVAISKALKKVVIFGTFLRIMVRSSAIETHLQSIEHLLVVDARKLWTPSEAGAEEDTDIADFQCLKPYSMRKGKPLLPWQSYRDWLQLMVHYFDSATILTTFIKNMGPSLTSDTISITILTPPGPSPDKRMLPWTKLLKTEHFSPTLPGEMSGKELIKALRDICKTYAPMRNDIKEVASKAAAGLESDRSASIRDIHTFAEQMKEKYTSPDQHKLIAKIIELTQNPDMELIVEGLNILLNSASFYLDLQQGSLHEGKGFKGRHHCEAYVASLLAAVFNHSGPYVADFHDLLDQLKGCQPAIGVSKRCCPVCAYLLYLLNTHCGTKFVVSDEHSNITPCSLPEWLPGNIVHLMVQEFSRRLKEELNKLTDNNNLRGRVGTSDTGRISIDSIRSELEPTFDEEDIDDVINSEQ